MNSIVTKRFIECHNKLKEDNRVRSSRQFALSLDYLPQSLSEILKGRRDVTIELLRKAIEKYAINPVFIFTGEGPPFMTEEEFQGFRLLTIVTDRHDEERIVHVPVPAQAGYAHEINNPVFIQDLPAYTLPDYKYKVGTHRSFDVSGDSMEPTLFEGEKVICSFIEPSFWESAVKDDYVYVIVTPSDVFVKRVKNELESEGRLTLISDNNFYTPFTVSDRNIREVWLVREKISTFSPIMPQAEDKKLSSELQFFHHLLKKQSEMIHQLDTRLEQVHRQLNKEDD